MICPRCARAADTRAPRDQHCGDPGCTCGHRVERYGTAAGQIAGPTGLPRGNSGETR